MNVAIVTGASSGMGIDYVKELARRGDVDEIWAIARNETKLNELKNSVDFPIRVVVCDLSIIEDIQRVGLILKEGEYNVCWLVNNAGFGKMCYYDEISVGETLAMINTNCSGLVAMTLNVLPFMKEGAKILNVSSAASFAPLPYMGMYAASKSFVTFYSRALNRELRSRGISVTAVCPYWVKTAFFETAHAHKGKKVITKYEVMYNSDDVVRKALYDASKGRDVSVFGKLNKVQRVLIKMLPHKLIMDIWQNRHKLK